MVSDNEKEQIRKQAEQLLEKFGKALESVKLKDRKDSNKVGGFRDESNSNVSNSDFRKRIFANAPEKNEDFIIAEKKSW